MAVAPHPPTILKKIDTKFEPRGNCPQLKQTSGIKLGTCPSQQHERWLHTLFKMSLEWRCCAVIEHLFKKCAKCIQLIAVCEVNEIWTSLQKKWQDNWHHCNHETPSNIEQLWKYLKLMDALKWRKTDNKHDCADHVRLCQIWIFFCIICPFRKHPISQKDKTPTTYVICNRKVTEIYMFSFDHQFCCPNRRRHVKLPLSYFEKIKVKMCGTRKKYW